MSIQSEIGRLTEAKNTIASALENMGLEAAGSATLSQYAEQLSSVASSAPWLPISGGTMTGALILDGSPENTLQAANKGYVDTVQQSLDSHAQSKSNPHEVTATQIGAVPATRTVNGKTLSSDIALAASDVGAIPASQKGEAGGVATLGSDGKVDASQLPEMGYEAAGTAEEKVLAHNISSSAHTDLRQAIQAAQEAADTALEIITEIAYTIEVLPSQSGSLTYTGSAQSPSWNSYNSEALTIGGTTSGTNAGSYSATFTPKDPYKWFDGTSEAKTVQWSIGRASVALPSQSGSLTYTGSAQSPSWSGYDRGKMTAGGTTSGTNAGSYSATFTPTGNYQWFDGTTGAKTVQWSIKKAAGSLSLSRQSVTITGTPQTAATVTVTRAGDGAVTATSGSSGVATASVSGTTVTIKAVSTGSATITVKVGEGTNHTAPASKTISVTVQMLSPTLANNTWTQIAAASEAGIAEELWQVGDIKDITVGGETLTVEIVGFNHDDLQSGGKAGITFGLRNLMASTRQMNSSETNAGGFTGSDMYDWLQGDLLSSLPSDLRAVLKTVNKKTSAGSQSSTINTDAMKIFLFSEIELFGSITYSKSGEGSQYPRFATTSSRIKHLSNGSGSASYWWERSPFGTTDGGFCRVHSHGLADGYSANYPYGVCFGFCV